MTSTSTSVSASFYTTFQTLKSDITEALNNQDVKKTSSILIDLKNQLRAINHDLPAYDQRSYESQIREFENRLSALRPKTSKFSFASGSGSKSRLKSKSSAEVGSTSTPTSTSTSTLRSEKQMTADQTDRPNESGIGTHSTEAETQVKAIRFENTSMERISLPSSSSDSSSNNITTSSLDSSATTTTTVILTNLQHCIIDLRPQSPNLLGKITSLHANNLERCILLVPVEGSILLHSITECLLVISSHQFRMHESRDTNVLISIPSMPIIEHCTNIGFGPLPPDFFPTKPMATDSRHWEVQDFDWVREGPSPNWRKIDHETKDESESNIENELVEALCQADKSRLEEGDVKEVIDRVIDMSRSL